MSNTCAAGTEAPGRIFFTRKSTRWTRTPSCFLELSMNQPGHLQVSGTVLLAQYNNH